MATHQIPILGFSTKPDNSGNVFVEPFTVKATNDYWGQLVAVFNDVSAIMRLYGSFTVPQNYVGSPRFVPIWSSSATSGNVKWYVFYRAIGGDDTESLDQATQQGTVTHADGAPSAAWERMTASMTATAGHFAAGDTVEFALARDGSDPGDTMAAAAVLFDLLFEYADA